METLEQVKEKTKLITRKEFEKFVHEKGLDPRYDGHTKTMHLYPKNQKSKEEYQRATHDAIEQLIFTLKHHFTVKYHDREF
jgi:adenine C2-methylase RlmN of 23S rRNA A2503 and tRNA A37